MERADVVVVGGGVAGLAAAYQLAARGSGVTLLEREPFLASHSSGRNAAIFHPLDSSPAIMALARRSRDTLDSILESGPDRWLRSCGLLLVAADVAPLTGLAVAARNSALRHTVVGSREIVDLNPLLAGGDARHGILLPDAGVMDIHLMTTSLARLARAASAKLVTCAEVTRVRVAGAKVQGVELANGDVVGCDAVIIAGGAWAARLGASCAAELPLTPLRRHLVQLEVSREIPDGAPVVWRLGDEVYFRPESGGILASPCDEQVWVPDLPSPDERAPEWLADKLASLAPMLVHASVRRSWACLRTRTPDRDPVAGADPRIRGLFWIAGLGGHGMTTGVALGEVVSALVCGHDHAMGSTLAPSRLLADPAGLPM
jgi:glycine/D-amino acid oxidase-like deaminating enzyme